MPRPGYEHILTEKQGKVGVITLNRPKVRRDRGPGRVPLPHPALHSPAAGLERPVRRADEGGERCRPGI